MYCTWSVPLLYLVPLTRHTRVVEISLAAAAKRDPSNLALHFYKNGENQDDSAGVAAFRARINCYRRMKQM